MVFLVLEWPYVPGIEDISTFLPMSPNPQNWRASDFLNPGGRGGLLGVEELKRKLYEQQSRRVPGMASYLNIICRITYGVDCVSLLFTSPSKLFHAILSYHGGDFHTACYVLKIVFLNPLAEALGKPELSDRMLELVKLGKDEDFRKLISSS